MSHDEIMDQKKPDAWLIKQKESLLLSLCPADEYNSHMSRWRWLVLILLCLVPWVAGAALFSFVIAQHFPQDGRLTMDIPVDGRSPWFEAFLPGQRASSPGVQTEGWVGQRISDEPVYARLRVPGAYDTAEVRVEFRPNNQPLLEFGVERGVAPNTAYELYPLWSRELVTPAFQPLTAGGVRWWSRPGVAASDLETPTQERLFWHASGTQSLAWQDRGEAVPQTVSSSLRGTHDFFFVPLNGAIDLTLAMQDVNRSPRHTTAALRLMRDQDLLWSDALSFGGEQDNRPSIVTEKTLHFTDLAPGVYRLSFLADDNIFIRGWTTTAKHWVIGPRVYFADEVGYSTSTPAVSVWTNSHHFTLKTLHPEGVQTVFLGERAQTSVTTTHNSFLLSRDLQEAPGPARLRLPKGNVWTLGDGYVSWSADTLFFPTPRRLTDETHLQEEAIQAVATTYQAPMSLGDGWYAATIRVALDPDQDRLKLVLAAPGIAQRQAFVDVRNFQVTYLRPPRQEDWWPALKQELIRAWRRW